MAHAEPAVLYPDASRQLAIIGDRLARRALVEDLRVIGVAQRLRGPTPPIGGARDGDRRLGRLGGALEAFLGGARIAEETQRDPAGVEGGVDLVGGIVRPDCLVAKLEGESRLIEIEQLARDHPPFAPPPAGIDQRRAIARRELEQRRRLIGAVRAPGVLDAGELETGIIPERWRDRQRQRRRQRPARRGDPGPCERQDVRAGEGGRAQGGGETLGIEQTVGAIFVVGPGDDGAEFAQDEAFGREVEVAVAPQGANDPSSLAVAAGGARRARLDDRSRARSRRPGGEKRRDLGRRLGMNEQIGFLLAPNPSRVRPSGMGLGEGGERRESGMSVRTERRPFEPQTFGWIARRSGESGQARDVALAIELGGGGAIGWRWRFRSGLHGGRRRVRSARGFEARRRSRLDRTVRVGPRRQPCLSSARVLRCNCGVGRRRRARSGRGLEARRRRPPRQDRQRSASGARHRQRSRLGEQSRRRPARRQPTWPRRQVSRKIAPRVGRRWRSHKTT